MADPSKKVGPKFNKAGICYLRGSKGQRIILHKKTWDFKRNKPERWHLIHNFDKIKETVRKPDFIKQSKKNPKSKLYNKRFDTIIIGNGITLTGPGHIFVVVILDDKFIQTIYTKLLKK
ncbi:MAG: hypothetical protein ACE5JC_06345 [Candidatus Zixiibacteriota bacterium]